MLRIAQITDTHVTAPERRLCGRHTPTPRNASGKARLGSQIKT